MSARILDGKATAKEIRRELADRVATLKARGVTVRLDVVLVGEDPASRVYVGNKKRSARKIGMDARTHEVPADVSQAHLEEVVERLGADEAVHGILVQLPLPEGLDADRVIRRIPPSKDVDGLHPVNAGELARGAPGFVPCTPAGIVELLLRSGVETQGKHVVIVGRSNLVGRPLAMLLLAKGRGGDATVTICHSRTPELAEVVLRGDIVVAAVGRAGTVTADMVREGAVVVDVGINRVEDPAAPRGSRLVGDVDFDAVLPKAAWITPVPGGVGPMTVALLLQNTVLAAEAYEPVEQSV
ncbi:MAG: bifunctional methylenetetrahydrofolate dehydrogenase/methenyltetrahydrofolate cyclohydrolase FolD [Gemmatimonadota bacterium]|jgi:methylenetetrahydrofolate dehydrogenase (NADP+)/methenyltetrahydrofolate cyclohydrolase|nr:bifunctional methylenetetrahydrofolate dehydrogenase/methenyltetrahydrofolate cyclohydrolase FolD [Gemmatimonadota bacterium]MDP6529999.1 bifunctional methylenetetrahydrofolate dehydrogenase/methenyltetrahydrofolate cyclohydrolase FolD [Gemmatimonadota bacterium]MDP6802096.1 bifunctional methylenetetrahydrofolate dehydrogenase/methenyltetrahydrofolate cyclohydrolase FolD [Gemmatimonadota bacterium]MDP7032646.1 bifunctional methylenetetrahydrofolate dehydrogenase/methenyltetrahydrofolate cyclo